jgi:hypothetical protein
LLSILSLKLTAQVNIMNRICVSDSEIRAHNASPLPSRMSVALFGTIAPPEGGRTTVIMTTEHNHWITVSAFQLRFWDLQWSFQNDRALSTTPYYLSVKRGAKIELLTISSWNKS